MTVSSDTTAIAPLGKTKLLQPIKVGANTLNQRIAFAPSTRYRATKHGVPTDISLEYYKARAQAPGSLIITEATFASPQGSGFPHVPGIYSDEQVQGWKKINEAIHEQKSFSAIQLWYLGRVGHPKWLKENGLKLLAPSKIYSSPELEKEAIESGNEIHEVTIEEIEDIINVQYPKAAQNALDAGFDYVEIHSAHGYFLDQFLNDNSNKRTDEYGGSIENKARLLLRIIDTLIPIVGADRLAVRLSPWAKFQNMSTEGEKLHSYILKELQKRADEGNQLAYISLVEPRVQASWDIAEEDQQGSNKFADEIWKGKFIKAGSYTYDAPNFKTLLDDLENDRTLIGFSRYFISNPDLVYKLKEGLPLTKYERATFYNHDNFGYNTWLNHNGNREVNEEEERKRVGKPLA
ncbi:unnamed protein product [Candida verbasci]|uniref:Probable NADPH dehydrogenase n=1 Tax=Candida verbasci TaxID=1227364 RepID=A0A9W4XCL5_9ASCO|nr:unnamed protein product [Candida verbasci]